MTAAARLPGWAFAAAVLVWSAVTPALASSGAAADAPSGQPEVVYETEVRAERRTSQQAAQERLDQDHPGFATAVVLDDDATARSGQALYEVLTRAPAATVRSLGGLGQFSSVSLRGSSGQQVGVFLDGVPLGSSMAGLSNLGDLPLEALGRLEIFRGYVPVEFGSAAIGGVVHLVAPASQSGAPQLRLHSGVGSFGALELGGEVALPSAAHGGWHATLAYASSDGDFPFLSDNNTPQVAVDDVTIKRTGNAYDRWFAQLRRDGRAGGWRYSLRQMGLFKQQQIPAPAAVQTLRRDLGTTQLRSIAQAKRNGVLVPAGALQLVLGIGLEQRHFLDHGEPASAWLRVDERMRSADVYVSPRLRLPLWGGAFVSLSADARYEAVQVDQAKPIEAAAGGSSAGGSSVGGSDGAQASGDATRARTSAGVGAELTQRLWDDRALLAPTVRLDGSDSRFRVPPGEGERNDAGANTQRVQVSPRLAARLRLWPGIEARSSVGRYLRPPNLMELFGDRGYIKGDEGLLPETGTSFDAGLLARFGDRRRLALYTQAAAFLTSSRNVIQWFHAGQRVRPENVEGALLRGVEVAIDASALGEALQLSANYTLLDARNRSHTDAELRDKTLPGRPRHEFFGRAAAARPVLLGGLGPVDLSLWYTFEYVAGTFLDARERLALPPRVLHGAGLQAAWRERWRAAVEARNLLDARQVEWQPPYASARPIATAISDFIGYPLPGRSVWLTLEVQFDFGDATMTADTFILEPLLEPSNDASPGGAG